MKAGKSGRNERQDWIQSLFCLTQQVSTNDYSYPHPENSEGATLFGGAEL